MVVTLTSQGETVTEYFNFPIEKIEDNEDGSLNIFGLATNGDLDSDSQIIDPDFAAVEKLILAFWQ